MPKLTIRVSGQIRHLLEIIPLHLNLWINKRVRNPMRRYITIRLNKGAGLELKKVSYNKELLEVNIKTVREKKVYGLVIEPKVEKIFKVFEKNKNNRLQEKIVIETNYQQRPKIVVPVTIKLRN